MTDSKTETPHYGISAVARLTGITVHTLRVWEKRYSAITAGRSESGHRHYSQTEVERLNRLKFLVDRGSTISSIASLSDKQLEARVAELEKSAEIVPIHKTPQQPRIAVFGEFLPLRLEINPEHEEDLDIVFATSDLNHFKADISRLKPDALILEFSIIDEKTATLVTSLQKQSGARRIVVIYSYAREIDISRLADEVICTFRAPVNIRELASLLAAGGPIMIRTRPHHEVDKEPEFEHEIPSRRFGQNTLARLANSTSSIDCECPHHLVDLVVNLSRFEDYSANCSSRNEEDAALHRYLQQTTARARAMMEEALQRVAVAEGLLPGTKGQ